MVTMKIIVITTLLVQTGINWNVKCFQGKENAVLKKAATGHAIYMAEHQVQGHQNWDQRRATVLRKIKGITDVQEVCAESWPGQTKIQAANEMYRSWYATRIYEDQGHWGAINRKAKIYGFAMARGSNGVWYACGIVGH